jgi:2-oxoisovalerate ferredoxin oxidoreductase alpha subunit
LRVFRPFPAKEIRSIAQHVPVLGIFDRSYTFGYGGAMFSEARGALYSMSKEIKVKGYIGGLGGRDVTELDLENVFEDLLSIHRTGRMDHEIEWVGLKNGSWRW